jgi:MFS family permease
MLGAHWAGRWAWVPHGFAGSPSASTAPLRSPDSTPARCPAAAHPHPPPPPQIPLSVFVYGLLAAVANGLFGFETSVISVSKLYFAEEFSISSTSAAYGAVAASLSIGATVGSFFAAWPQDRFGRRVTLVVACAVYIAAVAISFTAGSFAQLFVGRLITGVSVGIFSSTVPMYISELAPPSVRGKLVTVNQVRVCARRRRREWRGAYDEGIVRARARAHPTAALTARVTPFPPTTTTATACCAQVCIVLGILGGFLVGKALAPSWRWMLACGVPLAGLLMAAFIFITPYSPRWLVTRGRSDEARRVLLRIRGGNGLANKPDEDREEIEEAVEAELRGIEDAVASTDAASKRALLNTPWVRWAIGVGVILSAMQQFTGVNAVNAYAPDVLKGERGGSRAAAQRRQRQCWRVALLLRLHASNCSLALLLALLPPSPAPLRRRRRLQRDRQHHAVDLHRRREAGVCRHCAGADGPAGPARPAPGRHRHHGRVAGLHRRGADAARAAHVHRGQPVPVHGRV